MVVLLLGFDVKMGWGSACDILRRSRDCVIVLSLVLLGLRTEWSVCIGRECHSVLGGRRFQVSPSSLLAMLVELRRFIHASFHQLQHLSAIDELAFCLRGYGG